MMPTADFRTDLTAYERAWTAKMVDIWEEKLLLLGVWGTGALVHSLTGNVNGDVLTFRFMQYGIFVDTGVGYGYKGHGGDIQFLDEAYRFEHDLDTPRKVGPAWGGGYTSGKPRQKKPWFNKKFFASTMKLKADLAVIAGDAFAGIVHTLDDSQQKRKSRAKRPYGIDISDVRPHQPVQLSLF